MKSVNVTSDDWIQVSTGSVQFQMMSTNHTILWRQQPGKPDQNDMSGMVIRGGDVHRAPSGQNLWLRLIGGERVTVMVSEVIDVLTSSAKEIDGKVSAARSPLGINNYLFVGASILQRSMHEATLQSRIDETYAVNSNVHNRAVSGSTIGDLVGSIDAILADYTGTYSDMIVCVHVGGNDISANRPFDILQVSNMNVGLDYILNAIKSVGYTPVLFDMSFRDYVGTTWDLEYNGSKPYNTYIYRRKALEHSPLFCYPDGQSYFQFYNLMYNNIRYLASDHVHPSTKLGYDAIMQNFVDTIAYYVNTGCTPIQTFQSGEKPIDSKKIHISFGATDGIPDGLYVNTILSMESGATNILTSNGFERLISIDTASAVQINTNGSSSGDDSGFLLDAQFQNSMFIKNTDPTIAITIAGLSDSKTYTLRFSGIRIGSTEQRESGITIDGTQKTYISSYSDGTVDLSQGVEFTGIFPVGGVITFLFDVIVGSYGYLSGFDVIEE